MKAEELRRSSLFLLMAGLFSAGSLAACVGQIGGSAQTATGGSGGGAVGPTSGSGGTSGAGATGGATADGGGANPTGAGGTSASGVPIVTSGTTPAESAGTLVMRRLTYREYDHMLADLLGDTTAPAEGGNAWSPDAPNAVGYVAPTSVADLQVDLYNETANTVVETAFQALAAGKTRGQALHSLQDAHDQRRGDHLRDPVHHLLWISRPTGGRSRAPSRPICWRSSRRCAGSASASTSRSAPSPRG